MVKVLKKSPLCSRHDGRELFMTAMTDDGKKRVTLPAAMLDENCGATATEAARKSWVNAHINEILARIDAGGPNDARFDPVQVEEIL